MAPDISLPQTPAIWHVLAGRHGRWLRSASVCVVLLLALWLRWRRAWELNTYFAGESLDGRGRLIFGDEPSYDAYALAILSGEGFSDPSRVPLYPLWLAGLHWLTGENYAAVPYAQAGLGTFTVLLAYLLGRRLLGYPAGLLTAFFAATSFVLVRQTPHFLSEVMFTPALLLVAITLADALSTDSRWRFAVAGFCVGIANLVRPTLLFFPFTAALVLLLYRGWRRGALGSSIYVLAAVLTIAPWTAHNYARYHTFLPLATSNAALWFGSPEYYHLLKNRHFTYERVWDEVIFPADTAVPSPITVDGDRYWTARALRSIREEPLIYFRFAAEKLITYWTGDPNADWANTNVFNYAALRGWGFTHHEAVRLMIERALVFVALLGALVLRRRWPALLPVYLLLGYGMLLHAATVAVARLSEPFQPFLLLLIAGAISTAAQNWINRRRSAPATRQESVHS